MTTAMAAASLPCRRLPPAAGAGAAAAAAFAPSSTEPRHVGQESCDRSQPWAQRGSTRTFSPSANSPRQMAQTSASTAAPSAPHAPYTSTGMLRSARFLSPPAPAPAPPSSPSDARRAQRMRQRASELRPSAKRSANSSAARMMTMLVSKLASLLPPGLLLSACCASVAALPGAGGDPGGLMYQLIDLACTPMATRTTRLDPPTPLPSSSSSAS
ncbi:hypothetical protein SORBI_3003G338600 [Sorghum bicolor]|uniref:Uncharacterized protein n=1 Tax=Sorghum bicolor TaxID=4558 RepID=A0A1B6Q6S2_SORBI|nr:hypothetical protein SORBI_3003G338600 [Sorghum bicolor]